jgi:hypothetical protein
MRHFAQESVIVGLVPTIHNHCGALCMDVRNKCEHDRCEHLGVILNLFQDLNKKDAEYCVCPKPFRTFGADAMFSMMRAKGLQLVERSFTKTFINLNKSRKGVAHGYAILAGTWHNYLGQYYSFR